MALLLLLLLLLLLWRLFDTYKTRNVVALLLYGTKSNVILIKLILNKIFEFISITLSE